MSHISAKPVIFISFSHKDEPKSPGLEEVAWLTFVQSFLASIVKTGIFDVWVDEDLLGSDALHKVIKQKLAECDIFVLLASIHSLASNYVVDIEIATIRERQKNGESVRIFPIILSPIPEPALLLLTDLVLSPKDGSPLSLMSKNERDVAMKEIADDIAEVAMRIVRPPKPPPPQFDWAGSVNISNLPETHYERLVGRDAELARLDAAWADPKTNIISLIAEGGAGKSALVNEWLSRMRTDRYRGADTVLGWSFYNQGTKEHATSAEPFLDWVIKELGIKHETVSATAKGEAIADAIVKRRVLLVLDGCEPLQYGLNKQQGELKDHGLRSLLRRLASLPPTDTSGLVVLTSRLAIQDIVRLKGFMAPVIDVSALSVEAGAALLRDNGIWGTAKELKAASDDFGGHALALGLLASYLKHKHIADIRKRNTLRSLLHDNDNPRHDHAKRVMESYEEQWLADEPVERAIMLLMGLFDRPASADCLDALRAPPVIPGLTEAIVEAGEDGWLTAVTRLRDARLLLPADSRASKTLNAHPLVRDWFGKRLKETNEAAWRTAHRRLYEHLRKSTPIKKAPSLSDLAPFYQAIAHGCNARRFKSAFKEVYIKRICRQARDGQRENYSYLKLGAIGADLSALGWFFEEPYVKPWTDLPEEEQFWLLCEAGGYLRAQGRLAEALDCHEAGLAFDQKAKDWVNASITAGHLAQILLLMGNIQASIGLAKKSVKYARLSRDPVEMLDSRAILAYSLFASGQLMPAKKRLKEIDRRARRLKSMDFSPRTAYIAREVMLADRKFKVVSDLSLSSLEVSNKNAGLFATGLDAATLGRAHLGHALDASSRLDRAGAIAACNAARMHFETAIDKLVASCQREDWIRGIFARIGLSSGLGDWVAARRDLDEIEEICEPGPAPMKLFLCDMALERTRVALAEAEAFAPLNGMIDNGPPTPVVPDPARLAQLKKEAAQHVAIAADHIRTCGYHRRDEELAELQAVLRDERKFADLPPRV